MSLGKEQEKILKWIKSLDENQTVSPSDSYKEYKEETDYEASQRTFNNLLLTLKDKGLLESPNRGEYELSSRGEAKLKHLENPEDNSWTEEDIDTKNKLRNFIREEKEEEFYTSQATEQKFKIKISELDEYEFELVDLLENNFDKFSELLEEAIEDEIELDTTVEHEIVFDVDYFEQEIFKARSGSNSGQVVTTEGTIESVSETKNICVEIEYECTSCGQKYMKEQSGSKKKSPYKCDCGSRKFTTLNEFYIDSMEFVLSKHKEQNEKILCRYQSKEISEEVNSILKPGNNVRVSGVLEIEEFSKQENRKGKPVLFTESVERQDKTLDLEDFSDEKIEEVRQKVSGRTEPFFDFAHSLAPKIVDEDDMKEVGAAGLFGGSRKRDDGRTHVFIISNPGRGKSDLQEFIEETFPNTHYADGKQSSGVGLTATVEQEQGGRWRLKAGKLVFADKGMLCIDEFDKMDHEDASRLNTAMQKPTFPIDKAGVNARLPGEASIIATGNFTEYVDEDDVDYIREYIPNHAESLMDRFSLVYALTGSNDSDRVDEAILSSFGEASSSATDCFFSREELVIYRELARQYDPILTEVSQEYLLDWLQSQKTISDSKESSFEKDSKRYLVSLAKLTTMFARSRLSERTNERDAENAIELMVKCRSSRGLSDGESGISDFKGMSDRRKWRMVRDKAEELLDSRDDEVSYEDIADALPDQFDGDLVKELLDDKSDDFFEPRPGVVSQL